MWNKPFGKTIGGVITAVEMSMASLDVARTFAWQIYETTHDADVKEAAMGLWDDIVYEHKQVDQLIGQADKLREIAEEKEDEWAIRG